MSAAWRCAGCARFDVSPSLAGDVLHGRVVAELPEGWIVVTLQEGHVRGAAFTEVVCSSRCHVAWASDLLEAEDVTTARREEEARTDEVSGAELPPRPRRWAIVNVHAERAAKARTARLAAIDVSCPTCGAEALSPCTEDDGGTISA